jgi:hypothetical protein
MIIINMVTQTGGRRRRRTGKKRKANPKFLAAGNLWRAHVKKTMQANPSMKFGKTLLKLASKTYKKVTGVRSLRDSKYSVQVRPRTRKASKKKTKRPNKKTQRRRRKKRSFLGLRF